MHCYFQLFYRRTKSPWIYPNLLDVLSTLGRLEAHGSTRYSRMALWGTGRLLNKPRKYPRASTPSLQAEGTQQRSSNCCTQTDCATDIHLWVLGGKQAQGRRSRCSTRFCWCRRGAPCHPCSGANKAPQQPWPRTKQSSFTWTTLSARTRTQSLCPRL